MKLTSCFIYMFIISGPFSSHDLWGPVRPSRCVSYYPSRNNMCSPGVYYPPFSDSVVPSPPLPLRKKKKPTQNQILSSSPSKTLKSPFNISLNQSFPAILLLLISVWNGSESDSECDRGRERRRCESEAAGSDLGCEGDRRFAGSVSDPDIRWRVDSASRAGDSAQWPSQERQIGRGIRRSTHRLHLQHRSKPQVRNSHLPICNILFKYLELMSRMIETRTVQTL